MCNNKVQSIEIKEDVDLGEGRPNSIGCQGGKVFFSFQVWGGV